MSVSGFFSRRLPLLVAGAIVRRSVFRSPHPAANPQPLLVDRPAGAAPAERHAKVWRAATVAMLSGPAIELLAAPNLAAAMLLPAMVAARFLKKALVRMLDSLGKALKCLVKANSQ